MIPPPCSSTNGFNIFQPGLSEPSASPPNILRSAPRHLLGSQPKIALSWCPGITSWPNQAGGRTLQKLLAAPDFGHAGKNRLDGVPATGATCCFLAVRRVLSQKFRSVRRKEARGGLILLEIRTPLCHLRSTIRVYEGKHEKEKTTRRGEKTLAICCVCVCVPVSVSVSVSVL